MFQITGAFAEFERSMIRQRVNAGLKRAVEAGKQLGRPRIDPTLERRIQNQLRAGKGMLAVAKECGVGSGTVQRIKREMEGRPLASDEAAQGGANFDGRRTIRHGLRPIAPRQNTRAIAQHDQPTRIL
jgi:DNA invertase Pin-like site-specific DNA recombinase